MAGFRKAKPQQTALKIGLYGPAGSGKTFTSLLIAEGLAAAAGKRVAFVDTERGTDFYAREVEQRRPHPQEFDFDALYTRSLTETIAAIRGLEAGEHGVVILDSITHLWEAAIDAYSGKTTSAGTIPFHAWGKIKKPYKDLMTYLLNSPMHILICGRQKNEYGEDPESGELKMVGVTMKAEGETPYEPHVLIQMRRERSAKGQSPVSAFIEKDRSGTIAGRLFVLPPDQEDGFTFAQIAGPLLAVLDGDNQGQLQTSDERAAQDAEALGDADFEKDVFSKETRESFEARFRLAQSPDEIGAIAKELTPAVKAKMHQSDVRSLKDAYTENLRRVK